MSDLTPAYFALAGALGAALANQVGGIVRVLSNGRSRKQETAERLADAHEAKVRPLYETLIEATNQMRLNVSGLRDAYASSQQDSPVFGGLREAFRDYPDKLVTAAAALRIDGSEEANRIARSLMGLIEDLEVKTRSEVPGIQAILTDLIAALAKAEGDLIDLAREDFGAGRAKPGRRVLLWRSRAASRQITSS